MNGSEHELIKYKLETTKRSAVSRGYSFTLTYGNVRKLLRAKKCAYTGIPFDDSNHITFERVDNNRGYEPGNVIPVIARANMLKSNLSLKELRNKCDSFNSKRQNAYKSRIKDIKIYKNKIDRRKRHIDEQLKLLEKETAVFNQLQSELSMIEKKLKDDTKDEKIIKSIIHTLENNTDIGENYLTWYQKLRKNCFLYLVELTKLCYNATKNGLVQKNQ